VSISA